MSEKHVTQPPDGAGSVPTGWTVLAKQESIVEMIDTLLDLPAKREFNKTELSNLAGVSRKSVHTHIDVLLHVDLIEEVPGTAPQRYRFNPESDVAQCLMKLDSAVNYAGPNASE